jgi:hypothetical protein
LEAGTSKRWQARRGAAASDAEAAQQLQFIPEKSSIDVLFFRAQSSPFKGKGRWRRPVIGCALPQERHFRICCFLGKHTSRKSGGHRCDHPVIRPWLSRCASASQPCKARSALVTPWHKACL